MEYMIKSIKHSGTKGERGTDRTDGRYPLRIGRTVDLPLDLHPLLTIASGRCICINCLKPGWRLCVNYVKDSDGSDYSGKILCTSLVVDVDISDNLDVVVVETDNSIFEFVRVDCDEDLCNRS